jgi:hypothetical protein
VSAIGVRVFDEMNQSMAKTTTVSPSVSAVSTTYLSVQTGLPTIFNIQSISSGAQIAGAQLAMQYCQALVNDPTLGPAFFPGMNFSAAPGSAFGSNSSMDLVVQPLYTNLIGQNVATQPTNSAVSTELYNLITLLATNSPTTSAPMPRARSRSRWLPARRCCPVPRHCSSNHATHRDHAMKKQPPRRPPPPHALRNLNHAPPVTRREFMGRGLLGTSATVVGMSSFFSMFANPRKAYATLAPDIQALVTAPCNIRAGAGKVPFIAFDLAGGGNIAGSNALVGGAGGQLDFLTTAGYNKLGLPGNMIPNSSIGRATSSNTSLGIAMHSDSAYLRGIKARASATTMANVNGAVIPAISQTDTDLNPHNPMYGIHSYGAAGDLLVT